MYPRIAILFILLVAAARGAEPATDAPTIVLSPYEVSAQGAEFKNWLKISSPHFVLYTDASYKEATRVLRELEMGYVATQYIFRRKPQKHARATIILPTPGSDWRRIESKSNVRWQIAVSGTTNRVAGLITVQYDWQEGGIGIVRSIVSTGALDAMNLEFPFTIARGIGAFFETAVIEKNTITLGRQSRRAGALSTGWLPWDRFFAAGTGSKEFQEENLVRQLDGQGASFVQFILTHQEPAWLDRMMRWASWLNAQNPPTEAEFMRVFGQDWKTWQKTMEAFRAGGRPKLTTLTLPPAFTEFSPPNEDLPVSEMRELFVLAQILNQDIPASSAALDTLLARGLKNPSLREILVTACVRRNRGERLLSELEEMSEAGSTSPDVHSTLAELNLRRWTNPVSVATRLEAARVEKLRGWCRRALEIEPRSHEANVTLAWTEALAEKPDATNDVAIEAIYKRTLGEAATDEIVAALGVARWRHGDADGAKLIAQTLTDSPFAGKVARGIAKELMTVPAPAPVPLQTPAPMP